MPCGGWSRQRPGPRAGNWGRHRPSTMERRMKLSRTLAVTVLVAAASLARPSSADVPPAPAKDGPQFHGPARDNLSREKGLLQEWPKDGPPLAWTIKGIGNGYSSVAVAA